jgi:hypothetical protein
MKVVFADTFYFLAILNIHDAGHAKAQAFTANYSGRMVTTEWVLIELADALAGSPEGRTQFVKTRTQLQTDSEVAIISYEVALLDEGIRLYAQRRDKQWSLTDCISFGVMRQQSLTEALTADHHFEQAGFIALLK